MSNEIALAYGQTGKTIKAMIVGSNRTRRWNGSTMVAFSAVADASWETGLVTLTEQLSDDSTATGIYVGDFPAIGVADEYSVLFFLGTVSPGDAPIGEPQVIVWDGTSETLQGRLASDGLDLVTAWTVNITGDIIGNISGSVGAGTGSVSVDHDYGGTDALAYIIEGGAAVEDAIVQAYTKTDYDAGNRTRNYVRGETRTDANGRWEYEMRLNPGTYTLVYYKQGEYGPDTQEVTVTAP